MPNTHSLPGPRGSSDTSWPGQRQRTQGVKIHLGVQRRRIGTAMTKQLADVLQRGPLLEHGGRQAVPEKVRPHPWSGDASTLQPCAHGQLDRTVREQTPMGRMGAKEYAATL